MFGTHLGVLYWGRLKDPQRIPIQIEADKVIRLRSASTYHPKIAFGRLDAREREGRDQSLTVRGSSL